MSVIARTLTIDNDPYHRTIAKPDNPMLTIGSVLLVHRQQVPREVDGSRGDAL